MGVPARLRRRRWAGLAWLLTCVCLLAAGEDAQASAAEKKPAPGGCDEVPTGVEVSDHWVHFTVPPGLMPDPRFDGQPAKLEVHRVKPVYAHGKCPSVANRAAVFVHGRTQPGPAAFDLHHPAPEGGELSVQKALARAGIDTFAPSLLGYGRSTRFDEGLKDPGNASLRPYAADDTCANASGIYDNLRMPNKVLVQVACASHSLLYEGCTGRRCTPAIGSSPYGGATGQPWAGPHSTLKAALVEWITKGTFDGAASGRFTVDEGGVVGPSGH